MDLTDLVELIQAGGEGASKYKKASSAEEFLSLAEQAIGGKVDVVKLLKLVKKTGILENIDFSGLAEKIDRDGDGIDMGDIAAAASGLVGGADGDGSGAKKVAAMMGAEGDEAGIDMGDVAKIAGTVMAGVAAGAAASKAVKGIKGEDADAKATAKKTTAKKSAKDGDGPALDIDMGDVAKLAGTVMAGVAAAKAVKGAVGDKDDDDAKAKAAGVDLSDGLDMGDVVKLAGSLLGDK